MLLDLKTKIIADDNYISLEKILKKFSPQRLNCQLTQKNNIIGGKWEDDEKHPDFAWVPYNNPRATSRGGSENPYLRYGNLLEIMGDDVER